MFAHEHRRLYRALMMEGDNFSDVVQEFLDTLESELTKDSDSRRYQTVSGTYS